MSSLNFPPKSPFRRGHSRSLSHPFPSPFGGFGKRRNKSISKHDILDSDDDDDDFGVGYAPGRLSSSPRKEPVRAVPEDEFVAGRCMTCNSTVRWPRHLKVFRCTSCLAVNDLELPRESKDYIGSDKSAKGKAPPPANVQRKAAPLTVERTKAIMEDCVSRYLQKLLGEPKSTLSEGAREGRPRDINQDHLSQPRAHASRHLSPNSAVRPRNRTPSAGRPAGGSDGEHRNPFLTPSGYAEEKNIQTRNRSHSDVLSSLKDDQLPGEIGRPSRDREDMEHYSHPLIFNELEEYLMSSFKGCDCLNNSFTTVPPPVRRASEERPPKMKREPSPAAPDSSRTVPIFEPDPKVLLLGDLGENSSWWMNDWTYSSGHNRLHPKDRSSSMSRAVSSRNPRINWTEVAQWYQLILASGTSWAEQWMAMRPVDPADEEESTKCSRWYSIDMSTIEREMTEARLHLRRTLLKATENLLKRPRRPLTKPDDTRFLLILLENPMLYSSKLNATSRRSERRPSDSKDIRRPIPRDGKSPSRKGPPMATGPRHGDPSYPSSILKRIFGLLANLPDVCHQYLISWVSRFSVDHFERIVNLIGGFVTYRLTRQHGRKRSEVPPTDDSLIPSFASASGNTPAGLHAALNARSSSKPAGDRGDSPLMYGDDWQIRAAARVMSIFFTANNSNISKRRDGYPNDERTNHGPPGVGNRHGHLIPINVFYNTLLDYSDLVADFETWESKSPKFAFCQYPFFLSIWAKIRILEYDARRQMEGKAREAFFDSILSHKAVSQYLVLRVRRECLVEDSLQGVSEVVGTGEEEIKKGLRIEFVGEEGVDAGGLRKEWFLLLVREVFDPLHGTPFFLS
ncbi:hypothetical protein MAP00_000255 [Monascus purpureus]|nr:hypothetical protein MAP00_000255 [Monascus purpureus]